MQVGDSNQYGVQKLYHTEQLVNVKHSDNLLKNCEIICLNVMKFYYAQLNIYQHHP